VSAWQWKRKIATPYDAAFREASRQTGVPVSILKGVAWVESTITPKPKRSYAGAGSMMQFMPATARGEYGLTLEQLEADPALSILTGGKYLAKLRSDSTRPNWDYTFRSYNAGLHGNREDPDVVKYSKNVQTAAALFWMDDILPFEFVPATDWRKQIEAEYKQTQKA